MLYAEDTTVTFANPSGQRVEEVLTEDLGRLSCWIAQNGFFVPDKDLRLQLDCSISLLITYHPAYNN